MKYALLFRTHYWSDYLQSRFNDFKSATSSADVFVAYDATNSAPPNIPEVAEHSLNSIRALGLHTPAEKALWYCGDYPFYDFYSKHPSYDFYLMIENDVLIQGVNVDSIVGRAIEEDIDIVGAHFSVINKLDDGSVFSKGKDMYDVVRKCFFPVVGFKRSTLVALFAERLRQSESISNDLSFEFPFCESYVGSQTLKMGLKHKELGDLAPLRRYGASIYMLYEKLVAEGRPGIWHSVFPVDRYLDANIRQEYGSEGKNAFLGEAIVEKLKDAMIFSGIPISSLENILKSSAEGKQNRDLFLARFDEKVLPQLRTI